MDLRNVNAEPKVVYHERLKPYRWKEPALTSHGAGQDVNKRVQELRPLSGPLVGKNRPLYFLLFFVYIGPLVTCRFLVLTLVLLSSWGSTRLRT